MFSVKLYVQVLTRTLHLLRTEQPREHSMRIFIWFMLQFNKISDNNGSSKQFPNAQRNIRL